jgi:hypothetical protein
MDTDECTNINTSILEIYCSTSIEDSSDVSELSSNVFHQGISIFLGAKEWPGKIIYTTAKSILITLLCRRKETENNDNIIIQKTLTPYTMR